MIKSLKSKAPDFYIPKTTREAHEIQEGLKGKLKIFNEFSELKTIAGVDVGYDRSCQLARASIVLMTYPGLKVIERVRAFEPMSFPYIPGLLAFREIPAILAAVEKLPCMPHLFMVDGQGIAHPRRMGIAAHLGVLLDVPTIGVAKSWLIGKFDMPGPAKGEESTLTHSQEAIGVVLRSKDRTKPLFISPGHKIDIETSVKVTKYCITNYRLPEPTRLADKYSKRV